MQFGPPQFDLGDLLGKLFGAGIISWAAVAAFVKWALPAKLEAVVREATAKKFREIEAELERKPDEEDTARLERELKEIRRSLGDIYELAQNTRAEVAHVLGLMGAEQRRRTPRD